MDKAVLIAEQSGARLLLKDNVVCLEQSDGTVHRMGIKALKQIIVRGDSWLSSKLLNTLLAQDISVIILPGRRSEPARHLFPQPGGALQVRLAQYGAFLDDARRLALAQDFVVSKIEAQDECLQYHGLHLPFQQSITTARESTTINALMGVEGASSARYFSAWAELFDPAWAFNKRTRRPPRDPVNALLSLSYTLAAHTIGRVAAQIGFETALGFLHSAVPGRPALALDLLEALRPWVDEWVLMLCHSGDFTHTDFDDDPDAGCRLSKSKASLYFGRWYTNADKWLEQQAREIVTALRTELVGQAEVFGALTSRSGQH